MRELIKHNYPYFPVFGLLVYLTLFLLAVQQFPGGSINVPGDEGFDYFHNFLCDLTLHTTENGQLNPARPMAILGHLCLSFGMITFFYILPQIFSKTNRNTWLIRWVGVLSMAIFILMFTEQHDLIVTLTGLLGSVALIPFFIELKSFENRGMKILAYLCFVGSILVFISFETKIGFYYLPFFQKIIFLLDAWWVIWVSILVGAKIRASQRASTIPLS